MSTRKHKAVSPEVKKAIIEAGAKKNNQTQLAKQFNIPRETLQGILKHSDALHEFIYKHRAKNQSQKKLTDYFH